MLAVQKLAEVPGPVLRTTRSPDGQHRALRLDRSQTSTPQTALAQSASSEHGPFTSLCSSTQILSMQMPLSQPRLPPPLSWQGSPVGMLAVQKLAEVPGPVLRTTRSPDGQHRALRLDRSQTSTPQTALAQSASSEHGPFTSLCSSTQIPSMQIPLSQPRLPPPLSWQGSPVGMLAVQKKAEVLGPVLRTKRSSEGQQTVSRTDASQTSNAQILFGQSKSTVQLRSGTEDVVGGSVGTGVGAVVVGGCVGISRTQTPSEQTPLVH